MALQPRQTYLRVLWGDSAEDISSYLNPDLLSFTYTDKDGDEADDISIRLKDETGKWANSWTPDANMHLKAYLANGTVLLPNVELFCGIFFVDQISFAGPPKTVSIKAVSVPLNTDIRRKCKSKAWEKTTLKAIAGAVAESAELELFFDAEDDPYFDRLDQNRETDLKFLKRICDDFGLSIKISEKKLIIFDRDAYEKKDANTTLTLGLSEIVSWSFDQSHSETYKSVTVSYRDPKTKKRKKAGGYSLDSSTSSQKTSNQAVMTYTAVNEDAGDDAQEFQLKKRCTSQAEAKQLAEAKLKKLNSKAITGRISLVGTPLLVAGMNVNLVGFGGFDGKFYIDQATHSIGNSGYRTSLNIHKVI